MNTRFWIIPALLLAAAVAAEGVSAQAGGSATSQQCQLDGTTEPNIGIKTFHCQGGNCVVGRASSTMSPAGVTRAQDLERPANWEFTVEPTLWEIRPDGPAAGRIQDGDVLVSVNGYPITTQNGAFQLTSMATGIPLQLQVRREQRLVNVEVTPVQGCWPMTASAGSESTPVFILRQRQGVAGVVERGGGGATAGAVGAGGTRVILPGAGGADAGGTSTARGARPRGTGTGADAGGTVTAAPGSTGAAGGTSVRARLGGAGGSEERAVATRARQGGEVGDGTREVRLRQGRVTFEGAGLVLAGAAFARQISDGTTVITFGEAPTVESVIAGGLAERAGLRAGDIVNGVSNDVPLAADLPVLTSSGMMSLGDAQGVSALSAAGPGKPVVLTITRDGVQRQIVLQVR